MHAARTSATTRGCYCYYCTMTTTTTTTTDQCLLIKVQGPLSSLTNLGCTSFLRVGSRRLPAHATACPACIQMDTSLLRTVLGHQSSSHRLGYTFGQSPKNLGLTVFSQRLAETRLGFENATSRRRHSHGMAEKRDKPQNRCRGQKNHFRVHLL